MGRFIDNYPEKAPEPYDAHASAAQIASFYGYSREELLEFLAEARAIIANPGEPNRRRYNARAFLLELERSLREKDRDH